jgi:serine/threonine-protein kinase
MTATKLVELEPRGGGAARSRFVQGILAAASIDSPHIVRVIDCAVTSSGRGVVIMERLHGEDLGSHLGRACTMDAAEVAPLVAQACAVLERAHALGIVHGAIDPENLFLTEQDGGRHLKLLNLGVPTASAAPADAWRSGDSVAQRMYLSPEQVAGRPIDARSDLYSLAAVAYRCLAGRPPFVRSTPRDLAAAIGAGGPPPASSSNPSLAPAWDEWFAGMLQVDPDRRPCQNAAALAQSFTDCMRGAAAARGGATEHARHAAPASGHSPSPPAARRRRRSALFTLLAVAGTAVVGATFGFWRRHQDEHAAPPSATGSAASSEPMQTPKVGLYLSVLPREATLYLDGRRLPDNPFWASVSATAGPHRVRAEAPGYGAIDRDFTLTANTHVELALSPLAPSAELLPRPLPPRAVALSEAKGSARHRPARIGVAAAIGGRSAGDTRKLRLDMDRSNPWQRP